MILEEISKHDEKWRKISYSICKDKMLADDLVQEMYLKLMHRTKWNDYFVILTIKNLFIDIVRKQKKISLGELYYLKDLTHKFEPDDEQQRVLDEFNKLNWVQRELLLERLDKSLRDIQREFNINYGYAYRQTTQAKETIKNNLRNGK